MEWRRRQGMNRSVYPKRIPPNATNKPMIIAGAAEPAVSSGLFSAKPIIKGIGFRSKGRSYTGSHTGGIL